MKISLLTVLLFLLHFNFAFGASVNLNIYCNENVLSPKSQKLWNERKIILEEAISIQNFLDQRIDYLTRFLKIQKYESENRKKNEKELLKLQEKRIREIGKYKIKISKLNNELIYGKDGNCFSKIEGRLRKPKLGIIIQKLEEGTGLKVIKVTAGSLAAINGIEIGDIILELNQYLLNKGEDLISILHVSNIGDRLNFKILRNGMVINNSFIMK